MEVTPSIALNTSRPASCRFESCPRSQI